MTSPWLARALAASMLPILGGCSTASTPSSSPVPNADAAAAAGVDAGMLDAADSVEASACTTSVDAGVAHGSLTFARSSATLTPERDHHGTLIAETAAGPFLYVIGGAKDEFETVHADIQRAKIEADGSLGALAPIAQLPVPRAGFALGQTAKAVYLIGGALRVGSKLGYTRTTSFATLGADGSLGTWTAGPELPAAVTHAAAVVLGEWLYVFGGSLGASPSAMSVRAKLNDDGSLGAFENVTPLSPARSHHAAFARGASIYLTGGLTGNPQNNPPSRKDAVRAEVQCDGSLGEWLAAGDLPLPLSVSAAQPYEGAVYMLGGLTDATANDPFTGHVLRAFFAEDGSLTGSETLPGSLSVQRGHVHQTPIWKNHIYSVGGRGNDSLALPVIDVGTFQ